MTPQLIQEMTEAGWKGAAIKYDAAHGAPLAAAFGPLIFPDTRSKQGSQ